MRALWLVLLLPLWLAACANEPEDPEQRLRDTIASAEQAVEAREIQTAAAYISPAYRDARGRDARQLRQLLLGYLYRNRNIHLFTRIADLQLAEDAGTARVTLYAAMAGVPLHSLETLVSVRADLHRIELVFVDSDDGWRLVDAQWQRASLEELLE